MITIEIPIGWFDYVGNIALPQIEAIICLFGLFLFLYRAIINKEGRMICGVISIVWLLLFIIVENSQFEFIKVVLTT